MPETTIDFRRLTVEDIDEVLRVENLSFSHPWTKDAYFHELAENELAYYYGIFWEKKLLAFGGFWLIVDEGHIANVAVDPDYRRQGLGELLMRRLIPFCIVQGGKKMTLEVRSRNLAAHSLYRKLGFKDAGLRRRYYDKPKDDAIIMWVDLLDCSIEKEV